MRTPYDVKFFAVTVPDYWYANLSTDMVACPPTHILFYPNCTGTPDEQGDFKPAPDGNRKLLEVQHSSELWDPSAVIGRWRTSRDDSWYDLTAGQVIYAVCNLPDVGNPTCFGFECIPDGWTPLMPDPGPIEVEVTVPLPIDIQYDGTLEEALINPFACTVPFLAPPTEI